MVRATQWHLLVPLEDDENWRLRGRAVMQILDAKLREQGVAPAYAPEMPPRDEGWEGFITQPYRVLTTWIPDWSMHEPAGRRVVRVDTMAR